jgi:uncharacterized membrane protein YhaH (DUF805 family)
MANLLFSVNGRISRTPFWLVYLLLIPTTLALILFIEASLNNNPVLTLIVFVLYVWVSICIAVKRLHDIEASGWYAILLFLIPIAAIVVGCLRGTVGPNRFGSDPLAPFATKGREGDIR